MDFTTLVDKTNVIAGENLGKSDSDQNKQIVYRNFESAFLCFEFRTDSPDIFELGTHRIEPIPSIIGREKGLLEEKTVWPNFHFRNILWDMMKWAKFSIENFTLEPDRSG